MHVRQVHSSNVASPLSNEAPVQDYRGYHNLIMLLLFVNNLRLVIENFMKYGFLVKLSSITGDASTGSGGFLQSEWARASLLFLYYPIPVFFIFMVERKAARQHSKAILQMTKLNDGDQSSVDLVDKQQEQVLHATAIHQTRSATAGMRRKSSSQSVTPQPSSRPISPVTTTRTIHHHYPDYKWVRNSHIVVISLFIGLFPMLLCYYWLKSPLVTGLPCFWFTILLMKTISYVLVNSEMRKADWYGIKIPEIDQSQAYPNNITLQNLVYFILAPTLCYQASYPRSERFRIRFFVKRLLELCTLMGMMWFLAEQYSRPTLRNSLRPFDELNWFALLERLLKLSIPSLYIWLLIFYAFFHSYLNMWAEVLRFGDRQFYLPWWNASTIAQYWRLWNIPVYQFFKRHVYIPLRKAYPKSPWIANTAAFFISAIGHEVVVGVPTHIFQGWAFLGMISQIPL